MNEQPSWTKKEIGLLNTVLVLAQWDKRLPRYIAKLFRDRDQYAKALEQIRWGLAQTEPGQIPALQTATNTLTTDEWKSLYTSIAGAGPLRDLFKSETDPFADITHDQMLVMAGLSDISTDPQTMFYTRDEAFMEVLSATRQLTPPDTNKFIMDGLERFLYLGEGGDQLAQLVYDLACSSNWQVVLASLRDRRDYTEGGSSLAAQTLDQWNRTLTSELRPRIFGPNYVSRVPQELVRLAWEGRSLFAEASNDVPEEISDPAARRKHLAAAAFPLFGRDYPERLDKVRSNLQLRFDVAQHLTDVRRFAKMDAFVYSWPKVASLARARYKSLEYVEECFIERRARPSETELKLNGAVELYELIAADPQLVGFLDLLPRFGEIDENLFIGYKPMASVSVDAPPLSGAASFSTAPPPDTASKGPLISAAPSLNVVTVKLEKVSPAQQSLASPPPATSTYQVTLSAPHKAGIALESTTATIQLDVSGLVQEMLKIIGSSSPDNLQAFLKDFFMRTGGESKVLLHRAGTRLFEAIFNPTMRSAFTMALEGDQKVRVVVHAETNELVYLPWEWLPDPAQGDPLVRLPRFSLIRANPDSPLTSLSPLTLPLRFLAVMPNPRGLRTLNFDKSVSMLESVLTSDKAEMVLLLNQLATFENLIHRLETLKPQVVHFEGHIESLLEQGPQASPPGTVPPLSPKRALLLGASTGPPTFVDPEAFGKALADAGVQLLVFGNNDLSAFYDNPIADIASTLVEKGLPAVLASTRGVDDVTAGDFMSAFYLSFFQGATLEQALSDARTRISRRGGDWSAFALFANPNVLDFFSPLRLAS